MGGGSCDFRLESDCIVSARKGWHPVTARATKLQVERALPYGGENDRAAAGTVATVTGHTPVFAVPVRPGSLDRGRIDRNCLGDQLQGTAYAQEHRAHTAG